MMVRQGSELGRLKKLSTIAFKHIASQPQPSLSFTSAASRDVLFLDADPELHAPGRRRCETKLKHMQMCSARAPTA